MEGANAASATYTAPVLIKAERKQPTKTYPVDESTFDKWYGIHRYEYDNRFDAYKNWQGDPFEHIGETKFDRYMRLSAWSAEDARREWSSGGYDMYKFGEFPVALPALRQAYVDEVTGLTKVVDEMKVAGKSEEEIARAVHGLRRELGIKYKTLTPPEKLSEISVRNVQKYGDPLGPSIEWLRAQGKSWGDIIESALRPGGKDLGF